MSDELKTCTWCGRECRVETFGPSEFIEKPFSIWVCSNAEIFGGTCTHALAYMSEEDWQEEPRSDELIEAMARIIDPRAWAESARLIGRADDWALRGKPGGVDFEKMYRSQAVEDVSDSLSRARALIPIIRAHLEPTSEMVEAVANAFRMHWDYEKAANAALIAALAASPIGDVA